MYAPKDPGLETGLRKSMRELLNSLLPSHEDVDTLCITYLPTVRQLFGQGWDLLSKHNVLLTQVPALQLLAILADYQTLLRASSSQSQESLRRIAAVRCLVSREELELEARGAELKRLCLLRAQRLTAGQPVSDLDPQIRELNQRLRQLPQLQEGEILGERYQILSLVGKGGFARVYQAQHLGNDAFPLVAIKVLHSESNDDQKTIGRFKAGAQNMQALNHPHIVRIFDGPSYQDGFHYFVMEYMQGGDLAKVIQEGKLGPGAKLRVLLEVGRAIQFAHSRGLIHRDVKPQNILLDAAQRACLSDFDLVRTATAHGGTLSDAMLGTYLYAAPEQLRDARSVTTAADLYSLAVLTLFVRCGPELLKWLPTYLPWFLQHQLQAPAELRALLLRATHLDPSLRPTVREFCQELEHRWPEEPVEPITDRTPRIDPESLGEPPLPPAGTAPRLSGAGSSSSLTPPPVVINSPPKKGWRRLSVGLGVVLGLGTASALVARNYYSAPSAVTPTGAPSRPEAERLAAVPPPSSVLADKSTPNPARVDPGAAPRSDRSPPVVRTETPKKKPKALAAPSSLKLDETGKLLDGSAPPGTVTATGDVTQRLDDAQREFVNGNYQ